MTIPALSLPALALVLALGASGCAHGAKSVDVKTSPPAIPVAIVPDPGTAMPNKLPGTPVPTAGTTRYPYTEADVHFMSGMIGHHSQAVVMSKMAPTHGASARVRTLAERIINAQQDEIASMQIWLRDHNQPVPPAESHGEMMAMEGMDHDMPMPGVLTSAQKTQLDNARGPDFDRLFLTFMIQHHRGAVSMVETLFNTQGAAQDERVFKLASDVHVDQATEIDRMERMLAAMHSP